MKISRLLTFLLLLPAGITRAQAQDNPAPAPAAEPAQTEMQKWIATTDAQWQATFNRDVVDAHASELKKLVAQYAVSLETALTKASAAGDLDGALALRNEQKRFTETNVFPEQDDAADAASVKQIRAATRVQLVRVEKENAIRTKALHAKYDALLAQAQQQLTQAKRLDDALLVKAKREEVAAAWLAGLPASETSVPVAAKPKPVPVPQPVKNVGSQMTTAVPPGRALLSKEYERRWKPINGQWTIANGVLTGEGVSKTRYEEAIHPPFTLSYKINVIEGMRPRVQIGKIGCNNEGYDTTFALYPPGTDAGLFKYERKKVYGIALVVTHKDVKLFVDDKLISTAPGLKDPIKFIEFSAGDGWSKGRVEFQEITLKK